MSAAKFLVTGAIGETGRYTVQRLLQKGHAVRALVHREDERSEALRGGGAEVAVEAINAGLQSLKAGHGAVGKVAVIVDRDLAAGSDGQSAVFTR